MDFTRGQKVWTPEQGWAKYERALVHEFDASYVCKAGKLYKVRTSTITHTEYCRAAAAELVPFVKSIYITDSDVTACAEWLSENSSLTPIAAVDYVRLSPRGHRTKVDIEAPDAPQDLLRRLGVPLDSRNLAGWLMKEHNLLPVKQVIND
jgi:hypothetical protein